MVATMAGTYIATRMSNYSMMGFLSTRDGACLPKSKYLSFSPRLLFIGDEKVRKSLGGREGMGGGEEKEGGRKGTPLRVRIFSSYMR